MAVRQREYLLTVNQFNEPAKMEGRNAIALLLIRLILLEPGSDPLHPEMGVGLKHYRYGTDIDKLADRIKDQVETYLPNFQDAEVNLVRNGERYLNIEIQLGSVTYVYDSTQVPIPIEISNIKNN